MFNPLTIKSSADLPSTLPYVVELKGNLHIKARQPFGYTFHWLREVALGVMEGDLGLAVDAATEASLEIGAAGDFRQELSLDEQGRLRLQVVQKRASELKLGARLSASVQAATPLPEQPEQLVAAILGIHEQQWLKDLGKLVENAPEAVRDLVAQITPEALRRFAGYWSGLNPSAASKLWSAAADPELLRALGGSMLGERSITDTLLQLKAYAFERLVPAKVLAALESLAGFRSLDSWVRRQIESLFGPVVTEADIARVLTSVRAALGLRDSIYAKAAGALREKCSAELNWMLQSASEDTALMDCSFAFAEPALALFRRAWTGDYSWLLTADPAQVEIRKAALAHTLSRETRVELHLPFFGRKEWTSRLEALGRMEVASDGGGRLLVYHVEASSRATSNNAYQSLLALAGGLSAGRTHSSSSFTLSYADSRSLTVSRAPAFLAGPLEAYGFGEQARRLLREALAGRQGNVEVSLSLSAPGAMVSAWLDAPGERDPDFFTRYARVAEAVQRAMRLWLPYVYFSDPRRYEALEAACPLIVYQASRPPSPKPKYDFTYDVMSDRSIASFFRSAASGLPQALARVEELLLAEGDSHTAAFYNPKQARNMLSLVERRSKQLRALLAADACFVNALINLGRRGKELRRLAAEDPQAAMRALTRFAAEFTKTFHSKLRRLYGGQEFLALGSLLLVEATHALAGPAGAPGAITGVIRLSQGDPTQPESSFLTLVNRVLPSETA